MYATIEDFKLLLPASIRVGDQNLGTPSPSNPTTKKDQITPAQANYYIKRAQEHIDSRLRNFYLTPLRKIKTLETAILSDAISGSDVSVKIYDTGGWNIGDTVELKGIEYVNTAVIKSIPSSETLILHNLQRSYYQSDGALIGVLKFPDPIPIMTARLAIAIGFDILFTADQEPNVSSYGNTQRQLANNDIDGILDGTIKLLGQEHTGRRFIRGSLFDAYKSPTKDFQYGREKPSSGGG